MAGFTITRLMALIILCSLNSLAFPAPAESDLHKISVEIKKTRDRIMRSLQDESKLEASLEKAEVALSNIEREKNELSKAIKIQEKELKKLHDDEIKLLAEKAEQEKNINMQINASYRLGHEKNVKVLLNQQDTKTLSRSLVYSDYITRARLEALKAYEETLKKLGENKLAIENKSRELSATQQTLAEQEEKIKASYAERNASLKALQASIKTDENKVTQLKNDQAKLQELLAKIHAQQIAAQKAAEKNRLQQRKREQALLMHKEEQQAPKTTNTKKAQKVIPPLDLPDSHLPFTQNKGKLPWPTKGKLDNRYGKTRQPGDFHWEGIAFIAAIGSNVQSVHSGRIVFADWFRGKGLLVIIDHGNGYMSLYAHNQTLLKKTGELVIAGDNIATVGNSGGLDKPELYFEIRHQGKPINPNFWLTNKG